MRALGRLCAALVFSCALAFGVDWTALKPQGYVSDFAGVIDASSKAQLETYCARVEQQTGAEMAMVTIRSLEGEPVEDVANTIYRAWGVGKKGKDEGILLLLAVNDRRDRLEVGYGLEPLLPDGFDGDVLRAMRPSLRQSQYGEAMLAAASTIGSRIAQSKGVQLDTTLRRRIHAPEGRSLPWPVILFGIVVLLLMFRRGGGSSGGGGGGFLPGLILGSTMGGRRGGWGGGSSGGFGGFDSGGGGFGGFGGGDSGGGGASSDW